APGLALLLALAGAPRVGAVGLDEGLEVLARERRPLAERRGVGAKVIDPDLLGIALVRGTAGEEEDVGLDALGVEDAGRQAQDRVEVALVHEVGADLAAAALLEQ